MDLHVIQYGLVVLQSQYYNETLAWREAAKTFIAKTSSLPQLQVDRGKSACPTTEADGLAPWKIRRLFRRHTGSTPAARRRERRDAIAMENITFAMLRAISDM